MPFTERNDRVRESIRAHDATVADYITQSLPPGGRALVLYGAAHIQAAVPATPSSRAGNIDDALRQSGLRTSTIELTTNPDYRADIYAGYRADPSLVATHPDGIDIPDVIYDPHTNRSVTLQGGPVLRPGTAPVPARGS